jgi:hypothetical protein
MSGDASARYYTVESLGPQRYLTPEGFMVCVGTPVARVGEMTYGPGETPIEPGSDGRVYITRNPEEVFAPESIASLVGKPITDDHPPVDVGPENWKYYAHGVVINPHRGTGAFKDFLVADLFVWDAGLIDDINKGKRDVSCGYNPEYFPVEDEDGNELPGRGEQARIVYNHLALVTRGRCGPRCSIGDHRTIDLDRASEFVEATQRRRRVIIHNHFRR